MIRSGILAACVAVSCAFAGIWSGDSSVVYTPNGYGSLEVGQIGKGFYRGPGVLSSRGVDPIAHIWQQRAIGEFGYDVLIQNRLKMNFIAGGFVAFSTPQRANAPVTLQTHEIYYLKSANALVPFGNLENPYLQIQVGYFPYKYNPDVRNLGEYMFRTNTYPLIIYSDFDYPQANLLGLRINSCLFGDFFRNDLLLNSELLGVPVQDWSLSDVASVDYRKIAGVGGGISLFHFLDVYQGSMPSSWSDIFFGDPKNLDPSNRSYYSIVSPVINGADTTWDTTYFRWQAIKLMARGYFDPKKLIPTSIFGENDLRLYAEANIIGLKNYPIWFPYIEDRTIVAAGFNLPGFKYVDLINVEGEYCANRKYFYSDEAFYGSQTLGWKPMPYSLASIKRNPWRWSVYIKKCLFNQHLNLIAQVARDNKKLNFYYFDKNYMSFIETLPEKDNWWWVFKTEFKF